jgi:GntR family transcriptional regulator, transcriptional repressor for pyruvate dehydrogenase complex
VVQVRERHRNTQGREGPEAGRWKASARVLPVRVASRPFAPLSRVEQVPWVTDNLHVGGLARFAHTGMLRAMDFLVADAPSHPGSATGVPPRLGVQPGVAPNQAHIPTQTRGANSPLKAPGIRRVTSYGRYHRRVEGVATCSTRLMALQPPRCRSALRPLRRSADRLKSGFRQVCWPGDCHRAEDTIMTEQRTSPAARLGVQKVRPAYQQVSDQIREKILVGELPSGARLPNETEMSEIFGVSRSTIREALRVLSSQNLTTTTRGVTGGTRVARPEPQQVSDYLEASLGLLSGSDDVSLAELAEFRMLLEVPAAGLAALRHTEDDLAVLRENLAHEARSPNGEGLFEGHRAFHQTILEASGNTLLEIVTRPVFNILRTRFLREQAPRRFWSEVGIQHERILECIERGDSEGAEREMQAHLEDLAQTYAEIERPGSSAD